MKRIILIISAIFICSSVYAKTGLNIIDRDNSGLLNSYYKNELFDEDLYSIYYAKDLSEIKNPLEDVTIVNNGKQSGKSYSFTLFTKSKSSKNIIGEWSFDNEDAFDEMGEVSIERALEISMEARRKNPHTLATYESPFFKITDLETEYAEDDSVSAYNITYMKKPSPTHRFWRTVGEIALFSAAGEAQYWMTKDANVEDWEYKPTRQGFKHKFIDGWSLDTNNFRTNTIYHIYAGAAYYQCARANGYNPYQSTAFSFFGSLLWEYFGEFREQVSTNDMIYTPFAGALVGEGFRSISLYVENNFHKNIFRDVVIFVFDPMRKVNEMIDSQMDGSFKVRITFVPPTQSIMEKYMTK